VPPLVRPGGRLKDLEGPNIEGVPGCSGRDGGQGRRRRGLAAPRSARVETSLAFEVGSNHYVDKVTAAAGYAAVYGVVTPRIASF
jgi:hypothetical protein